jgi:hypothetical protein
MQTDLSNAQLEQHGATAVVGAMYRMEYALTEREIDA